MPYSDQLPIFFPLVLGFRLVMRAVTDPSFPEPIWHALQVRNEITQYVPLKVGESVDFRLITVAQRFFEKGAEVDFELQANKDDQTVWSGIVTFYYRGRFSNQYGAAPKPPEVSSQNVKSFLLSRSGGFQYGKISGDFNGIHLFKLYAKIFGFKSDFLHPHRVVGAGLERVQYPKAKYPQKLDLWFRGPVPYGGKARLEQETQGSETCFALFSDDQRPSIIGKIKVLS